MSRFTRIIAILPILVICLYIVSHADLQGTVNFTSYNPILNLYVTNVDPRLKNKFIESHKKTFKFLEYPWGAKSSAYCLNNKDPSTLTPKQRLAEFASGPCAPILILPGIMATALQVEITNCTLFQEKYPTEFEDCGWNTCDNSWSSRVWSKVAPKEVKLWVSVSSLLSPYASASKCFAHLAFLRLNESATEPLERYSSIEGIKVTWLGNTPETKATSDCGISAIIDYAGVDFLGCELRGFDVFTDYLKGLGYESGLTLQAMPYDFRKAYIYNDLPYQLKRSVKLLYELSGKKVILFAHSLGNLNALPFLNSLDQSEKDKMIHTFFSAGAPFTGATKALRCEISGETNFYIANRIGLDMEGQKGFLGGSTGMFDAFPKDTFFRFSEEEWMQDLITRVQEEDRFTDFDNEAKVFWEGKKRKGNLELSWFPSPLEKCNDGNFGLRGKECKTHIRSFQDLPIVKIGDEEYYAREDDLIRLVDKHVVTSNITRKLYQDALKTGNNLLNNPGVQTVLLYGAFQETELSVEYDANVANNTRDNLLTYPKNTIMGVGDGTILATSTITAGAKWIWERNRNIPNTKGVKVLEYCSLKNNNVPIYELDEETNTRVIKESTYIGRKCSCMDSGNFKGCKHSCYISEPGFLETLKEIITTNERGVTPSDIDDGMVQEIQSECLALTLAPKFQDVLGFVRHPTKMMA